MSDKPIFVTKPSLPPLEEFMPYLEEIWTNKILTNGGPFHQQLEEALAAHLGVEHISLFNNGATALLAALHALQITGEVITTPYSFVATAHSLLWTGLEPVFVDIDPTSLNLDPAKIESAITPRTTAILPVHVYGNPCAVDEIDSIAKSHGLRVIYDAAHAFGIRLGDRSLLSRGDLSMLSFHATKVFNTFEGGAVVSPTGEMKLMIDRAKNFGFEDEVTVGSVGLNGKMNEVQAAFGLLQLQYVDAAICKRKRVDATYRERLLDVEGIRFTPKMSGDNSNYSYFPILVDPQYSISRDALYAKLRDNNIYGRRYFYPLISDFTPYRGLPSARAENLPVAREIASRILCLPIYPDLAQDEQDRVIALIRDS
jgi:dTDP-4-amino-4,6-dideoxygalactose transaminase